MTVIEDQFDVLTDLLYIDNLMEFFSWFVHTKLKRTANIKFQVKSKWPLPPVGNLVFTKTSPSHLAETFLPYRLRTANNKIASGIE